MGLRIRCPSCDASNRVDEEKRGARIRCRECDERFRVPEEDEEDEVEDRPVRKKTKKKKKAGIPTLVWVLGGVGAALLLLIMIGGVGAVFIYKAGKNINQAVERAANRNRRINDGGNMGVIAKGKVILDKRGNLTRNDPADPTPDLAEVGARMQVHQVMFQANKAYVIELRSDDFDAYLRLENAGGKTLKEDDDSGGDLDARIVFRSTQAGMHRVIVTSWDGDVGAFHLRVQEAD